MRDAATEADVAEARPGPAITPGSSAFDSIAGALRDLGPCGALERLVEDLDAAGDYRALLDAMLLRARHELGLPLVAPGSLAEVPEPVALAV